MTDSLDPTRDLVLERELPLTPAEVWAAWTTPEILRIWFAPRPWRVGECEVEAVPGGIFRTVMLGPEGESFDGAGCVLECVPEARFVWTDALGPGFRPNPESFFTGVVTVEATEKGSRYKAVARHGNEEAAKNHAAMGFETGWGAALDQMVEEMLRRRT